MTVQLRLGKGLIEPQPPFRRAWFFGADLNSVSADGWESLPSIDGETASFDLSSISINHEVAVALIRINNARGGMTYFKMRWYRARDNKLLFTYDWSYRAADGGWVYCYSYIGWVDWEINENGDYYVVAEVSGANPYSASIYFTISGIREEPPPEPPPPTGISWIADRLVGISNFFYSIGLAVNGWIYPFWGAAEFFFSLHYWFMDLAHDFVAFNEWVNYVTSQITIFLTSLDLEAWFLEWKQRILDTWDWVRSAWQNVTGIINNWWLATKSTVQGWIDIATEGIDSLIAEWDNFWRVTFPTLVSFDWLGEWWNGQLKELESWFYSKLQELAPFWEGWQEVKSKVVEFISDPLQWFYDRLEELFERFW